MHAQDRVAQELGMSIDHAEPGHAVVSMSVTDVMVNGLGVCHGGIVFTLADTAMAHASNAAGRRTLSTSASIEWIRAVHEGDRLTATSCVAAQRGKNTVHDITVTADDGGVVAMVRGQTLTLNS
jgi:acyl-CoA thioesterase